MVKSVFDDTGFDETFLRVTYFCLDLGSFLNYSFHLHDQNTAQIHKTLPISSDGKATLTTKACRAFVKYLVEYAYPTFCMI